MLALGGALTVFLGSAAALGQSAKPVATASRLPDEDAIGLDKILDRAVQNLTIRYNLNEDQAKLTSELMHARVKKFLQDHQREVWPVLRELMHYQLNGENPDPEAAKRIARAALPLLEEAKKAIRDGNADWRGFLLNDQQRQLHDFDLSEMEIQFKTADQTLKGWNEGKPDGGMLFPPEQDKPKPGQPPKPVRPTERLKPVLEDATSKDRYTAFVDDFIKQCQLDASQTTSARSILKEILEKVEAYKAAHREELDKLAEEDRKAVVEGDLEKRKTVAQETHRVLEPLQELFDDMVTRLEGLLRSQQKEIYLTTLGKTKVSLTKPPPQQSSAKPAEASPNAPAADPGATATADSPKPDSSPAQPTKADPEKDGAKKDSKGRKKKP